MYEKFYGLKEKPFNLTPDPDFLFESDDFRAAFDNIIYGIKRFEGFTAIVGDVGTGKTTLCWALLGRLDEGIRTALILNPLLTEEEMLKAILQDFGIRTRHFVPPAGEEAEPMVPYDSGWLQGLTRKELIDELNYFLLDGAKRNVFNVLIIDEAQDLSPALLEQLRILSNLETAKKKLLQIIFVGQLEFEKKLQMPELRQLNQRVTIRYALKPLSRSDTEKYIGHRLSIAGSARSVGFTRGALRRIYDYSQGYPRLINIVCDRALLAAYSERTTVVTPAIVRKAIGMLLGNRGAPRVRFKVSARVMIPIVALLVLALISLLFWRWHEVPALSGADAAKASPLTAPAVPEPQTAIPEAEAAQVVTQTPRSSPAPNFKPARTVVLRTMEPASDAGASETGSRYILQLHSLVTRAQADAALGQLQSNGYRGFAQVEANERGRQWYVVYAGPYDSLERAQSDAEALGRQWVTAPSSRR